MHMQLGGDSADTPLFGMIITQNLRFEFRGNGHVGYLFGLVGQYLEPGDGEESCNERSQNNWRRKNGIEVCR
jgi:hypothetical protein